MILILNKLFRGDHPFWIGMGRIFDVFVLNILWLLCCLPVVTIGPSTTAFFYAMIQLVQGGDTSVSKDFFHSFRQNFKQGLLLGLPLTAVGVFLALDVSMSYRAGTGIYTFFMVFFAVVFLFWAFLTLYAFPLLAKFDKSNRDILILAFTLSIKHIGKTLLMMLTLAFGLWACHILPGLIFIAFGLVGELIASMMVSILKPYLPNVEEEEELKPLSFPEGEENRSVPEAKDSSSLLNKETSMPQEEVPAKETEGRTP